LIQEGNLGLYSAVRTFDFTLGVRFSTHARWHIRSGITRALAAGKVERQLTLNQPGCSLDAWVADGRGGTEALAEQLWDAADPDAADALFHQQLHTQIQAALSTLEDREARVISRRFGITGGGGTRLDAVAKSLGLTRDGVRRIEVAAMGKLKDPSRSNALQLYHVDC
jgi:RNA polymerase primary sigma factor/RNA polymerase nonessential primary-like sigma factor